VRAAAMTARVHPNQFSRLPKQRFSILIVPIYAKAKSRRYAPLWKGAFSMRAFLVAMIAVWATDTLAFEGRFTQTAWQEAKYQGHQFNYYMGSKFKRAGL
jgi:hypothetical protein